MIAKMGRDWVQVSGGFRSWEAVDEFFQLRAKRNGDIGRALRGVAIVSFVSRSLRS